MRILLYGYFVFGALTLLVEHQLEHLACKNWVMRYWRGHCLEQDPHDLHIVQQMPLPHHHLLTHSYPKWIVYFSGAVLPWKGGCKMGICYYVAISYFLTLT